MQVSTNFSCFSSLLWVYLGIGGSRERHQQPSPPPPPPTEVLHHSPTTLTSTSSGTQFRFRIHFHRKEPVSDVGPHPWGWCTQMGNPGSAPARILCVTKYFCLRDFPQSSTQLSSQTAATGNLIEHQKISQLSRTMIFGI